MHEHDTDLIISVARGQLDDAMAATAEAEIAACARCRADLELQRSAIDALDAAPRVYLTAKESARIRTAVRNELGLQTPVAVPRPRRRRFPLAALAGAAAVVLAVVVAGPVLDIFGTDADQPRATSNEAFAPTTSTAESSIPEAALQAPEPSPDAIVEEAPPSLAATAPEIGLGSFGSVGDLERLRELVIESGGPRAFLETAIPGDGTGAPPPAEGTDRTTGQDEPVDVAPAAPLADLPGGCDLSAVSGVDPEATPSVLGPADYNGTPSLVVAYAGDTPFDLQLVVLAADTCEVLAST